MKKFIMLIPAAALMVANVFAAKKSPMESFVSNIKKKPKIMRVDSHAKLPFLEDKYLLPASMSIEEYLNMLKSFLDENNSLLNPKLLKLELDRRYENLIDRLSRNKERFATNIKDEFENFTKGDKEVIAIDVSCPNIINYAKKFLKENGISESIDPSELDADDEYLKTKHLRWIIDRFGPFVDIIQEHEINPGAKYDSGLSDRDIDLLIKLIVGDKRVFDISKLSDSDTQEFYNKALIPMLTNATGFQLALSLLIMSTINYNKNKTDWQIHLKWRKGVEPAAYSNTNTVWIDPSYRGVKLFNSLDNPLSALLFHEMTHALYQMIDILSADIWCNISIVNSRDLNLIDQYFPMIRPQIMNPVLRDIGNFIDKYFGHNFNKLTEEERQKLVIVVLEPIIRNAMTNGFGTFFFPDYKPGQSLKISTDTLTTKNMAMCIYLSNILAVNTLYSSYDKDTDTIMVGTTRFSEGKPIEIETWGKKVSHPLFNNVKVILAPVSIDFYDGSYMFGKTFVWGSMDEKLTMQGNAVFVMDKDVYYIQNRQNEQTYLLRESDDEKASIPISRLFRYHRNILNNPEFAFSACKATFKVIADLLPAFSEICSENNDEVKELLRKVGKACDPSDAKKYELTGFQL